MVSNLNGRLNQLEGRFGPVAPAGGPYTQEWKQRCLPSFDWEGFEQLFETFWEEMPPEARVAILAAFTTQRTGSNTEEQERGT
jgi:hypothetical protein